MDGILETPMPLVTVTLCEATDETPIDPDILVTLNPVIVDTPIEPDMLLTPKLPLLTTTCGRELIPILPDRLETPIDPLEMVTAPIGKAMELTMFIDIPEALEPLARSHPVPFHIIK